MDDAGVDPQWSLRYFRNVVDAEAPLRHRAAASGSCNFTYAHGHLLLYIICGTLYAGRGHACGMPIARRRHVV